jgi:hypothetical protein
MMKTMVTILHSILMDPVHGSNFQGLNGTLITNYGKIVLNFCVNFIHLN